MCIRDRAKDFASAKTTVVANETRWDGIHDTIERSTDLEMPMYKAKSALINCNVLDMMDLDDDESSVDADAELPLEEDSLSDASSDSDERHATPSREKKWEDRMAERFPEKKAWHGGHGLRTALGAPRAFNKLIQHSTEPTVHLTFKLARGVINASSRTPVTMTKWVTSGESMVLGRERVMAVDLPSVAQTKAKDIQLKLAVCEEKLQANEDLLKAKDENLKLSMELVASKDELAKAKQASKGKPLACIN